MSNLSPYYAPGAVSLATKARAALTSARRALQSSEAATDPVTAINNDWLVFLKHLLVWDIFKLHEVAQVW